MAETYRREQIFKLKRKEIIGVTCSNLNECAFFNDTISTTFELLTSTFMKEYYCKSRPHLCKRIKKGKVKSTDNCFNPLGRK